MITEGVRPDGSEMLPPMPYAWLAKMTPDDLAAVIALPADACRRCRTRAELEPSVARGSRRSASPSEGAGDARQVGEGEVGREGADLPGRHVGPGDGLASPITGQSAGGVSAVGQSRSRSIRVSSRRREAVGAVPDAAGKRRAARGPFEGELVEGDLLGGDPGRGRRRTPKGCRSGRGRGRRRPARRRSGPSGGTRGKAVSA